MNSPLAGLTIGVTAERRAHQQQRYLEARGALVNYAPVLQTVDHSERPEMIAATNAMIDQSPDVLVVQTGQGLRWWLEAMGQTRGDALLQSLGEAEIWCRGCQSLERVQKSWTDGGLAGTGRNHR